MYLSPVAKRRIRIACAVLPFLLPGWRGDLVPVTGDERIVEAGKYGADEVIGATRRGDAPGEEWQANYLGSRAAEFFDVLNLRTFATHVVPPDFVAHIPPGTADLTAVRADAYFRVVTHPRWPWWWPGGGVDWTMPAR